MKRGSRTDAQPPGRARTSFRSWARGSARCSSGSSLPPTAPTGSRKLTKRLVVQLRIPAEKHLAPQRPKILERIPDASLVTIEHDGNGRAYESKAGAIGGSGTELARFDTSGLSARLQ